MKQNKTKTDLRTSGRKKKTSDYVSMIVMLKFQADLPYQS